MIALALLAAAAIPAGAVSDFGTQPLTDTPSSLRLQAMGECVAAIRGTAASAGSNPAGLADVNRAAAVFGHSQFGDTRFESFALAVPRWDRYTLGLATSAARTTGVPGMGERGEARPDTANLDAALSLAAAARAGRVAVGGSLNAIRTQIGAFSRTDVTVSSGARLSLGDALALPHDGGASRALLRGLSVGAAVRHLVGVRTGGGDPAPAVLSLGLAEAIEVPGGVSIEVAGELTRAGNASPRPHAGFEVSFRGHGRVRGGYAAGRATFGAAAAVGPVAIEYAGSSSPLGLSHRAGIAVSFGPTLAQQRAAWEEREKAQRAALAQQLVREIRGQMQREGEQSAGKSIADARTHAAAGRFEQARTSLATAQAWQPKSEAIKKLLVDLDRLEAAARADTRRRQIAEALSVAEASLRLGTSEGALDAAAAAQVLLSVEPQSRAAADLLKRARGRIETAPSASVTRVPDEARRRFDAGMKFFLESRYEDAADSFLDAVRLAGKYPQASDYLSQAMLRIRSAPGLPQTASNSTANRKRAEALYNDGVQHYVAGRLRRAASAWREALALDPGNDSVRRDLDQATRKIERMESEKLPIPD